MSRTTGQIKTADGTCPVSIFRPGGAGPWPAVIFYMDGLGPRPALFDMGERMAGHGYYVLLPDLFYRAGPYETPQFSMFQDPVKRQEWGARFASTASQANVMRDTRAFLDFLSAQPEVKQPEAGGTEFVPGFIQTRNRGVTGAARYPILASE